MHTHVEVMQLPGISSILTRVLGSHSWVTRLARQVTLPTEPFHWPLFCSEEGFTVQLRLLWCWEPSCPRLQP